MEMDSTIPHVLIFPFPVQGHVNSMLRLAQLLCLANLKVTFLNSTHNHHRLLQHTDAHTRMASYPGFRLEAIPDGLPDDHPRTGKRVMELVASLESTAKPAIKEMLMGVRDEPVTCFIVDGLLGFAYDVGEEVGVPVVAFRTISATCFWAYFCIPRLLEARQIPIKEDTMDELVKSVPGMEAYLRYRDLPSFLRAKDLSNASFKAINEETQRTPQANALILNTFEELEGPILSLIRTHCCPIVYSIGPLHAQLQYRLDRDDVKTQSDDCWVNSLWEVDRSCINWLDAKPEKSVIYVSFGSLAVISKEELREFLAGLVMSKKSFLWVIRPDLITGEDLANTFEPDILEGIKERGFMVRWAPQEEVLAHRAVGGFLTHSGWNSTLESIDAGMPMLCWPFFADQQVNSRCVEETWKIGLDMKDRCDREIVGGMVNSLMEGRKAAELGRSMSVVSKLAKKSVAKSGASYCNLDRLIGDIRKMTKKTKLV